MAEGELVNPKAVLPEVSWEVVEALLVAVVGRSDSCHLAFHEVGHSHHSWLVVGPVLVKEP